MEEYGVIESLSNGIEPRYRISYVEGDQRIAFAGVYSQDLVRDAVEYLRDKHGRSARVWDTFLGKEHILP